MRIMIKGGVWKNIEDEILKAAVMKYGLNQWSRISSLLVRKSAKQCKARWYEWLDPSIRKTEWSREEEEKLLHLAKIFPTQWKTIAPIIGRTAAQCLEHYERLLEQAAGKEQLPDEVDPRKLKPGEIDPVPETRPPRPDPEDMDEDEKEMLQEARARLSNTKGKKAKRKAREKQLEEARRLATLQRKRELKASGIEIEIRKRIKPKIREMDYIAERPFYHDVPSGLFPTAMEEDPDLTQDQMMISAQQVEASRRDEQEAMLRNKDESRIKKLKERNFPAAVSLINKLREAPQPRKKAKLSLPPPQLSEIEIEKFAKLGEGGDGGDPRVTDTLLANYKQQALVSPAQMMTPATENPVLLEAHNALVLSQAATPLEGGANVPLVEVSEMQKCSATPNAYLQYLTPTQRDTMSINTPEAAPQVDEFQRPARLTADKLQKLKELAELQELRKQLDSLPSPQNDYSFDIPDLDPEPSQPQSLQDAELEDAARKRIQAEYELTLYRLKSEAIKRDLPRPLHITPASLLQAWGDNLVSGEMITLLQYDMKNYPMKGARVPAFAPDRELLSDELMEAARELVNREGEDGVEEGLEKYVEEGLEAFRYVPRAEGGYAVKPAEELSPEDSALCAKKDTAIMSAHLTKLNSKVAGLETSVKTATVDLQKKAVRLEKQINDLYGQLDTLRIQQMVFSRLQDQEKRALEKRLAEGKDLVAKQAAVEEQLQRQYSEVLDELKQDD